MLCESATVGHETRRDGLVAPSVLRLAQGAVATMRWEASRAIGLIVLGAGIIAGGAGLSAMALHGDGAQPGVAAQVTVPVAEQPELAPPPPPVIAQVAPDVAAAIKAGVRFLKENQQADGSWPDADSEAHTGTTSLVTLALLAAGEPLDAPAVTRAAEYLRGFTADRLRSVYAVSLQTMVFAAVNPVGDKRKIELNARWLQDAQIKPGDRVQWPGSWSYTASRNRNGDNSNTQYALLGLRAAREAGIPIRPEVWTLARRHWEQAQRKDGGWGYTPDPAMPATASMTCAGIASLVIIGHGQLREQDVRNDASLKRGIDWMGKNFRVLQNFPIGRQWRYYYFADLERAGRLSGQRFFGAHDWYQAGVETLLEEQDRERGFWKGTGPVEGQEPAGLVATSFALLFLSHGRLPAGIEKAAPAGKPAPR
jgi:hypothetical protein